jgi:hypothetical protein
MNIGTKVQYRYKAASTNKRNVGVVISVGRKRATVQFECGLVVDRLQQSFKPI